MGIDMLQGAAICSRIRAAASSVPAFRRLDLGDGVEKFSCHYESRPRSRRDRVLDIGRCSGATGWPVAGENVKGGIYAIESAPTGTALELAVQGVPVGGLRAAAARGAPGAGGPPGSGRGGPPDAAGRGGAANALPLCASANTDSTAGGVAGLDQLAGRADRCAHVSLPGPGQQQWAIAPVANAGGYPGSPSSRSRSPERIAALGRDRRRSASWSMRQVAPARRCKAGRIDQRIAYRLVAGGARIRSGDRDLENGDPG